MLSVVGLAMVAPGAIAFGGVSVTPEAGPPTTLVLVEGGVAPGSGDLVTITFDGVAVASVVSHPNGSFTTKFHVPASATPGVHTVAAESSVARVSTEFYVHTFWNEARYELAWGFNPYENVLSKENVAGLGVLASAAWEGHVRSEPIYTQGIVVAGSDDGTVRALDPSTGDQLWSFDAGGPVLGSPAAVFPAGKPRPSDACAIVAASSDGMVYGIDPGTGAQLWSYSAPGPVSTSPATASPDVIVAGDDGSLSVLDGCDGASAWSIATDDPGPAQTPIAIPDVELPDGTTDTIIVVCFKGVLAAFDAATGSQLWSQTEPGPIQGPSAYGTRARVRVVYASGSEVVERNASTGAVVWSHPTGAPVQGGVALNFKETVTSKGALKLSPLSLIAGDEAGQVLALKISTGKQLWSAAEAGAIQHTSPAVANGVVYMVFSPGPAQDEGSLQALDVSTGASLFSASLGEIAPGSVGAPSPSVADGRLYVGGFDDGLRVFALGVPTG